MAGIGSGARATHIVFGGQASRKAVKAQHVSADSLVLLLTLVVDDGQKRVVLEIIGEAGRGKGEGERVIGAAQLSASVWRWRRG